MPISDAPISDLSSFVTVAENASFTRAAEKLATTKSSIGKAVRRLEDRLGVRLLQRTTRAVRLTEDGEIYLQAARSALAGLREAEIALSARSAEPIGRVRIDMPMGFARLLLPMLADVRRSYPKLTLEASFSDHYCSSVEARFDIAVRIGDLPVGGALTVHKLAETRLGLYASASYLNQREPIQSAAHLDKYEGVFVRDTAGKAVQKWLVTDQDTIAEARPSAGIITSDGRSCVDAAVMGFGIAQIIDRIAAPHLMSGELRHILPESDVEGPSIYAIIPSGYKMLPKASVVLDRLLDLFNDNTLKPPAPAESEAVYLSPAL
jgi:DNA-binding transcriptional LysR family regulator